MGGAARYRADQVETARTGVTGLDAVGALIAADQIVMGGIPDAFVVEARQPEIGEVLRIVIGQMTAQHGQVAGGGNLQGVGQARGVVIVGFAHADLAGAGRHHLGEMGFGAAQGLGDHHRHVIGAADHDGADGGIDIDGLARPQGQLGRLLDGGVIADRHLGLHGDLARLQGVEQQVQGHHLGQRGGMTLGQFIAGIDHLAGGAIHDQGGVLLGVSGTGGHANLGAAMADHPQGGNGGAAMVLGGQGRRGKSRQQQGEGDHSGQEARPIR